jgi:hypothetical protein
MLDNKLSIMQPSSPKEASTLTTCKCHMTDQLLVTHLVTIISINSYYGDGGGDDG